MLKLKKTRNKDEKCTVLSTLAFKVFFTLITWVGVSLMRLEVIVAS